MPYKDPEKKRENNRRYREENREELKRMQKIYYQKNREKISERRRQYYQKNRERILNHQQQFYRDNREKILEYKSLRQIRMFGKNVTVPDREFREFAIALREERRRHQTEGATRG